mgnify:CR=1 FL=1
MDRWLRMAPPWALAAGLAIASATLAMASAPRRPAPPRRAEAPVDFNRDVRPILSANCFPCHGPDAEARQAGLRLDRREEATRARPTGRAIVPGKPEQSRVYVRITAANPARRMPPAGSGHALTPRDVEVLRRWIAQGAPYAEHWAFVPPKRPPLPRVRTRGWVRHPIDAFVLARLEQAGMRPAPEADRYTLIRRVSLDLTGLPPTPEEVEAFVRDRRPDAYERVVDRLLASPHFGERWARMWLDLARYADSAGLGSDPLRPNLWPYRDWVIAAFNRNLPYDQFTIEQIAGDLLPNPTEEQLVATAFHRNTMTNTEGGTDDEEWRVAAVKDRVATTMQVWMGLTFGCAQCHSHKYDPISQREYYQVFAIFNQTEDHDQPDERPTLPLLKPEQRARQEQLRAEIAELERRIAAGEMGLTAQLEQRKKELAEIKPVPLPIMRELPAEKQRPTHVLVKGNFLVKGEAVAPAVPAAFHPLPPGAPRNRLGLARWLVSRDNPLTARVAVNRFWAQLFGTGLVETEEDFGTQGTLPTHPELLDWLAVEFMEPSPGSWVRRPWDVKGLLKTIVMSATYRQSSRITAEHLAKDPRNRLLGRYPRRRLDAEGVRRAILDGYASAITQKGGRIVLVKGEEALKLWESQKTNASLSFPVNLALSAFLLTVAKDEEGRFIVDAVSTDGGMFPRNIAIERTMALVRFGALSPLEMVAKLSWNPSRMLGLLNKGHLAPGADADITVIDPQRGKAVMGIVAGRLIMLNGRSIASGGTLLVTKAGEQAAKETGLPYQVLDLSQSQLYAGWPLRARG